MLCDYANLTIESLVSERFSRSYLFERLHIDYYCCGSRSLKEACKDSGLNLQNVMMEIESLNDQLRIPEEPDWNQLSPGALIDHILETHHAFLRRELPTLDYLMDKVLQVHGEKHSELHEVRRIFETFRYDLEVHLGNEEFILFPLCRQIENADHIPLSPCVGCLGNQIERLEAEHKSIGNALTLIRKITNDYMVPNNVCSTFKVMLQSLSELEVDIHKHLYKENQLLFPKALEMERSVRETTALLPK